MSHNQKPSDHIFSEDSFFEEEVLQHLESVPQHQPTSRKSSSTTILTTEPKDESMDSRAHRAHRAHRAPPGPPDNHLQEHASVSTYILSLISFLFLGYAALFTGLFPPENIISPDHPELMTVSPNRLLLSLLLASTAISCVSAIGLKRKKIWIPLFLIISLTSILPLAWGIRDNLPITQVILDFPWRPDLPVFVRPVSFLIQIQLPGTALLLLHFQAGNLLKKGRKTPFPIFLATSLILVSFYGYRLLEATGSPHLLSRLPRRPSLEISILPGETSPTIHAIQKIQPVPTASGINLQDYPRVETPTPHGKFPQEQPLATLQEIATRLQQLVRILEYQYSFPGTPLNPSQAQSPHPPSDNREIPYVETNIPKDNIAVFPN